MEGKVMNRFVTFFTIVLVAAALCPTCAISQTWQWQNPLPQGNTLNDAHFIDANNGWAVGNGGTILHTTDGGLTWTRQACGTNRNLKGVWFANASRGWAVGGYQTRLYTTNGGITWITGNSCSSCEIDYDDITGFDADRKWAVGRGEVISTADSGFWYTQMTQTWHFESVCFVGASNGWTVGDYGNIYHTTNAGHTWSAQTGTGNLKGVTFVNSNYGWAVGTGGLILHTTDAGTTWTSQSSGFANPLTDVTFRDENIGWAVGYNINSSDNGAILKTTNGGVNWTIITTSADNWLNHISFPDANNGRVVGNNGTIMRTTNAGTTWSTVSQGVTYARLTDVDFVDASNGWAVGSGILHTTNGGETWYTQAFFSDNTTIYVDFIDANEGWVGKGVSSNEIVHTTDGGQTWSNPTNLGFSFSDICFVDHQNGWCVGSYGWIKRTTDGGASWFRQYGPTTQSLYKVDFVDVNNGWIVGYGLTIWRTTDGGYTWAVQSSGATGLSLTDVDFVDASVGWCVSDMGSIRHTTDGGNNWTWQGSAFPPNSELVGVEFVDTNHGWCVGSNKIQFTTNGGALWQLDTNLVAGRIYALRFLDLVHGWAVGDGGMIIHYGLPPNQPPVSVIDSITANSAVEGDVVDFFGHGTDSDGTIIAYDWRSSVSGQLSTQASFSTDTLPAGEHLIYFKVMDDDSAWSSEVCGALQINAAPLVAPDDLVILVDSSHAHLYWNPVGSAQEYKVFSDSISTGEFNTLIATVADTFFVDSNAVTVPPGRRFYLVRSCRP
jgi:photosystem II stability/assembly factor-like uncharacterized protein